MGPRELGDAGDEADGIVRGGDLAGTGELSAARDAGVSTGESGRPASPHPLVVQPPRTRAGGGHLYTLPGSGKDVPSVTSITDVIAKPFLMKWAANQEREAVIEVATAMHVELAMAETALSRASYVAAINNRLGKARAYQRTSAAALDIGTQVHKAIEYHLRVRVAGKEIGARPELSDAARLGFDEFLEWESRANVNPIWIEQMVYHPELEYAGTLDLVASVGGSAGKTLIDFKTSKAIYPEYALQLVGYWRAVEAMGHGPVDEAWIVRIPKLAGDHLEVARVSEPESLWPVFTAALEIRRWLDSHGE